MSKAAPTSETQGPLPPERPFGSFGNNPGDILAFAECGSSDSEVEKDGSDCGYNDRLR